VDRLAELCFAHQEMFVVPIEHLSPEGMDAGFRDLLERDGRASRGWTDLFSRSFALYWCRAKELSERAPLYWFPPRLQHVCVATQPERVRPFFQPLHKCSWLTYRSDFDPEISNAEFGAYQFFHAERMGLLQEVGETVLRNLGYWILRSDAEAEAFRAAAWCTPRPDGDCFRALADALPWARRAFHQGLTPPPAGGGEPPLRIPHTGLLLPGSCRRDLERLVERWTAGAREAARTFYQAHSASTPLARQELCAWLLRERPALLVTAARGRILWDPADPESMEPLSRALLGSSDAAVRSIHADLAVIDERSRRFLLSLRHPESLPQPDPGTTQSGLSYLHVARRLIAYNLEEQGMERLRVPAPPFERLMLGARTVHEWAHVAVDAGWVPVASGREEEHESLREELSETLDEIVRGAPRAVRDHAAEDLQHLAGRSAGEGLAALFMARVPDYQANLLARRYLSGPELETYVRSNVYDLSLEYPSTALFRRLARYAFERQYLRFSEVPDARSYFLRSTWFGAEYLETGILSEAQAERLFETAGRLLDCYALDESAFA
jgi:hypothetical protein